MSDSVINKLSEMSNEKQLLFGLLAAERFFICYKIFSQKEEFGNVVDLLQGMNTIERIVIGEKFDSGLIDSYIEKVEKSTPHMDDYGSVNGSLALNVCGIIYETLNIVKNFEIRRLKDISTFCTDSIDFLILEIEDYDQMDRGKILNHPLMQEELELQKGIVAYLERISEVDSGDIETLREMQDETKFDKLNLNEIFAQ